MRSLVSMEELVFVNNLWWLWTTFFILFSLFFLIFFNFFFNFFFYSSKHSCLLFKNWIKYLFGELTMFFILKIYNIKILFWLMYRKTIVNDFNEYYSVALWNLVFVYPSLSLHWIELWMFVFFKISIYFSIRSYFFILFYITNKKKTLIRGNYTLPF